MGEPTRRVAAVLNENRKLSSALFLADAVERSFKSVMGPGTTPLPPDSICGYAVLRSLAPSTYLALADGGRNVVLKPLDVDCLLHGQLHPSIKERLSRVRELALKSTANLHGVEREAADRSGAAIGSVYLVWEFIDGETLESRAVALSSAQLIALLREVVLSVDALHQVGIVHGALHARNIIVDLAGRPRLTHISPLLFNDPSVDEAAIGTMLAKLIENRRDLEHSSFANLAKPTGLRELAATLVAVDFRPTQSLVVDLEDTRRRRRMFLSALSVGLLGVFLALAILIVSRR